MALDERYITDTTLEPLFVDKITGLPLAAGWVYFWEDNQRNTPKPVYQLTGAPPNYTYTALPNPIKLSSIGTFQNAGEDNIAVYYYPYDDEGEIELYYIQVFSADNLEVPQFTREAWPNITDANSPGNETGRAGFNNALSNPQFVEVLFDDLTTLSIPYSGTATTIQEIAPNWFLRIVHAGAGSVSVSRQSITGTQNIDTQPPYTLTVQAGANISTLELYQRLEHNPDIWSSTSAVNLGYIAASVTLANSSGVQMYYRPSNSAVGDQLILDATNNTGAPKEYRKTTQLITGDNTDSSDNGYVDIVLKLSNAGTTRFTSVQIVGMAAPEQNVAYDQEPVNRQLDHLAHYYKPQLAYKPIPSYLVGWDFGLNPRQFGTTVGPIATGANKSYYAWDQTIIFQTVTNGTQVTEDPTGGLRVTAQATGQCAVIQYLEAAQARELLSGRMSVAIRTSCSFLLRGVISLFATTDANLPTVSSPTFNSVVATMNADGSVATMNGAGWVELPRKSGKGLFTSALVDLESFLSGWTDNTAAPLADTATFFAIVVGFPEMDNDDWVNLDWVSLNAGDIATRPAPQSKDEIQRQCERFYEMSYESAAVVNVANTLTNAISFPMTATIPVGGAPGLTTAQPNAFHIKFSSIKRVTNPTMKLYSPIGAAGDGQVNVYWNAAGGGSGNFDTALGTSWTQTTGNKYIHYIPSSDNVGGQHASSALTTPTVYCLRFHYIADARLGVVN